MICRAQCIPVKIFRSSTQSEAQRGKGQDVEASRQPHHRGWQYAGQGGVASLPEGSGQRAALGVAQEAAKGTAASMFAKKTMSIEEARMILGIDAGATLEEAMARYQKMFEANEKASFYLQSKIHRAKERLEQEFGLESPEDVPRVATRTEEAATGTVARGEAKRTPTPGGVKIRRERRRPRGQTQAVVPEREIAPNLHDKRVLAAAKRLTSPREFATTRSCATSSLAVIPHRAQRRSVRRHHLLRRLGRVSRAEQPTAASLLHPAPLVHGAEHAPASSTSDDPTHARTAASTTPAMASAADDAADRTAATSAGSPAPAYRFDRYYRRFDLHGPPPPTTERHRRADAGVRDGVKRERNGAVRRRARATASSSARTPADARAHSDANAAANASSERVAATTSSSLHSAVPPRRRSDATAASMASLTASASAVTGASATAASASALASLGSSRSVSMARTAARTLSPASGTPLAG